MRKTAQLIGLGYAMEKSALRRRVSAPAGPSQQQINQYKQQVDRNIAEQEELLGRGPNSAKARAARETTREMANPNAARLTTGTLRYAQAHPQELGLPRAPEVGRDISSTERWIDFHGTPQERKILAAYNPIYAEAFNPKDTEFDKIDWNRPLQEQSGMPYPSFSVKPNGERVQDPRSGVTPWIYPRSYGPLNMVVQGTPKQGYDPLRDYGRMAYDLGGLAHYQTVKGSNRRFPGLGGAVWDPRMQANLYGLSTGKENPLMKWNRVQTTADLGKGLLLRANPGGISEAEAGDATGSHTLEFRPSALTALTSQHIKENNPWGKLSILRDKMPEMWRFYARNPEWEDPSKLSPEESQAERAQEEWYGKVHDEAEELARNNPYYALLKLVYRHGGNFHYDPVKQQQARQAYAERVARWKAKKGGRPYVAPPAVPATPVLQRPASTPGRQPARVLQPPQAALPGPMPT